MELAAMGRLMTSDLARRTDPGPPHQQVSTLRRQARILVNVHPGDPSIIAASVATHSLTGLTRMNNLHSNDS
jgi:hypothetical protein